MKASDQWELEVEEISVTAGLDARIDAWAEILAGLANVEDARLPALCLKAQEIATGEPAELRAYLEDRIDEIYLERVREKRTGRVLGEEEP